MAKKKAEETVLITMRLLPATLKAIDKWGRKTGRTNRSETLRALLDAGLQSEEQRAAAAPPPAWLERLEELATRLNTDPAGMIAVFEEHLATKDEPAPAAGQGKPKKGVTLRSIFGLV